MNFKQQGGKLVAGKYGNALGTIAPEAISYPKGKVEFGLPPAWKFTELMESE